MKDDALIERTAVERLTAQAANAIAANGLEQAVVWASARDVCEVLSELERLQALVGRLEGALSMSRAAIASCDPDTFGVGDSGGLSDPYPVRDELIWNIDQALLVEGGG